MLSVSPSSSATSISVSSPSSTTIFQFEGTREDPVSIPSSPPIEKQAEDTVEDEESEPEDLIDRRYDNKITLPPLAFPLLTLQSPLYFPSESSPTQQRFVATPFSLKNILND